MEELASFVYASRKARVLFGDRSLEKLTDEVQRIGAKRALILCTPERRALARIVATKIGARAAGVYDNARMHVPAEVVADALATAERTKADCYVAVGGGSTIGLAKALALSSGMPILAVPTTYAGSEMTNIYGITERGAKKTGRSDVVAPVAVIYEPSLTFALPRALSAASGMNAIAHCLEALYAPDGNPIISIIAAEGIMALAQSLPTIMRSPSDAPARSGALYGSWLAGLALGSTSMGLHHKLCHVLGGGWNLPHAETHSVVLPYVARYNREAAPEAMRRVAIALGCGDAVEGLFELAKTIDVPTSLASIGMPKDALVKAARIATETPYPNPRAVSFDGVLSLLEQAYAGVGPGEQQ